MIWYLIMAICLTYFIISILVALWTSNVMDIDESLECAFLGLTWPLSVPVVVLDVIIRKHINRKYNK